MQILNVVIFVEVLSLNSQVTNKQIRERLLLKKQ